MIKWCSYCVQFIGEFPPLADFQISHGVCNQCLPKVLSLGPADLHDIRALRSFFVALQETARTGSPADVQRILEASRRLLIRPLDLMIGILQPLLVEVGERWAAGELTVAAEHRFSALAADLLAHLTPSRPAEVRPRLVLVNAEDNDHTMGLQMADAFFTAAGIATLTVQPGLPTAELLDLLDRHRPEVLGFSIALPGQMRQVLEVAARAQALPAPPRHILVGGPAVRMGLGPDWDYDQDPDPAPGVRVCTHLDEILPLFSDSAQPRGL